MGEGEGMSNLDYSVLLKFNSKIEKRKRNVSNALLTCTVLGRTYTSQTFNDSYRIRNQNVILNITAKIIPNLAFSSSVSKIDQ